MRVDEDRRLSDTEPADLRVEEVVTHLGDHPGDDSVTIRLGSREVVDIFGCGQTTRCNVGGEARRAGAAACGGSTAAPNEAEAATPVTKAVTMALVMR